MSGNRPVSGGELRNILQSADVADGQADGIVNLDSKKAIGILQEYLAAGGKATLSGGLDRLDGTRDGRVEVERAATAGEGAFTLRKTGGLDVAPTTAVAAPTASELRAARAFDLEMSRRFHVEQPYRPGTETLDDRNNCIASVALGMLRQAGAVRDDAPLETFTAEVRKLGSKAHAFTRKDQLPGFNAALGKLAHNPTIGTGVDPNATFRSVDHDAAIARMKAGGIVLAWTDYSHGSRNGVESFGAREHVVAMYYNPHSQQFMALDPLDEHPSGQQSVAFPLPIDGRASSAPGHDIRLSLSERFYVLD